MNNNIIIGTAGHVDHGKTCLIRALTGIDTDRLMEEKKRGITIELGFAYLDLPDGGRAGIIDVPGHEKFIKNMLAGAGGIDIAMLIVAADEGVMPQTAEHLGILSLLGIDQGVIVLTKTDMVDSDWLELITEDIRQRVAGTFLENAPIMPVSSYTGAGIDELRQLLFGMIAKSEKKNLDRPFRLPVDRVFVMEGFGTVITGTLIEGTLREGDEIMLYPSGKLTRARNIQVHSTDAEQAVAGQRVAVNLAGLKKDDINRGDVLAPKDCMRNTMMADVRLTMLPDAQRSIKNTSRLHFYHGAREVLCKTVLLDRDALNAGDSCYAQMRFEEEVCVRPGDRFVVRFYSPLETVGGGIVLDPNPFKHKRGDEDALAAMAIKEHGTMQEKIEQSIREHSRYFYGLDTTLRQTGCTADELQQAVAALTEAERIVQIDNNIYLHTDYLTATRKRLIALLNDFHKANPLKAGIKQEELRSKLLPQAEIAHVDAILRYFMERKSIKSYQGLISLNSFKVELSEALGKLTAELERLYDKAAYLPPATDEVVQQFAKHKQINQVLSSMIDSGVLVRLDAQIYMHRSHFDKAVALCCDTIRQNGQITLGEFRDALGTSRKFAMAILDHLDRQKVTKKTGDFRVLCK